MDKNLLKRELQMCYSDQAEHFAHTREKKWPEIEHITTFLGNIQQHSPEKKYTIVELGCGAGRLYPELKAIWGKKLAYIGCDLAPGMIEQAVHTYGGTQVNVIGARLSGKNTPQWVVDDMIHMLHSLPDNSVDCIISIASLQHLMNQQQRMLLWMHMYRVLRYKGNIISVNRSYSDWFLGKYRTQQLSSILKSILYIGSWSWNDIIIPWKDPHRQENKRIRRRYYHIFTLYELEQLSSMHGFVINTLGFVLQEGNIDTQQRRKSRNSLLIATKDIA